MYIRTYVHTYTYSYLCICETLKLYICVYIHTFTIYVFFLLILKFARHVKVIQEDSPYFSLLAPSHPGGKVAPGMEVTYTVVFTPDNTVVS